MRDPNRIPEVLKNLQEVWEKTPDLRLMQLLMNAFGIMGNSHAYNCEDERLMEILTTSYLDYDEEKFGEEMTEDIQTLMDDKVGLAKLMLDEGNGLVINEDEDT